MFTKGTGWDTTESVALDCLALSTMFGDEGLGPKVLASAWFPITLRFLNDKGIEQTTRPYVGLILMEDVDPVDPVGTVNPVFSVEPVDVGQYSGVNRALYQHAIVKFNTMQNATKHHGLRSLIPGLPTNDLFVRAIEKGGTYKNLYCDFKVWHVGVEPASLARLY